MAIDFPDSPSNGDTHTVGDKTWTWDGTAWNVVTSSGSDHGNLGGLADDDHSQYALADGTRGTFEASGAVSTHEAASDPHTQYLLADGSRTATELTVTNTLTVDTNTLHVDSTNNRVGIGTTAPEDTLHVYGPTRFSSTTGQGTTHFPFTDGRFYYTADPETGGAGDHVFRHNSSGTVVEQMRILENGNVGIGTTTPADKLHVAFTNGSAAGVVLTNSGNTVGKQGMRIGFDNDRLTFQRASDTGTWETNYVAIDQDTGNVGIGTTSPGYKLEVDNTLTVKGTSPFLRILETTTVADAHLWLGQDGTIGEGLHVWYESSTGASYIDNIFYNASLYLRTNSGSSTGVGIDALGRVTTPNQPSFIAYGAGYQSVSSGGDHVLVFETTSINRGGHYSTSNGRFTAPVTGVYVFHLSARIDGISSSSGYYRWAIRKNGTLTWAAPNPHVIISADGVGTSYMSKSVSGFVYLSANDYVEAVFNNSGSGVTSGLLKSESQFSGHFIG